MTTIGSQNLVCAKGDTFAFEIDMQLNADGSTPDLTGATASWVLAESWIDGSAIYVTKATGNGVFIQQENGVWKVIVAVDATDTLTVPAGTLYHECKVVLSGGDVAHVASGTFELTPSVNP